MLKSFAKNAYRSAVKRSSVETATYLQFIRNHRYLPDFKYPKTFSEKVCKLKLNWSDERYVALADKILVKKWVQDRLGETFVIPTLFSGPELPPLNARNWAFPYVVKANHGSAMMKFIKSSQDVDWPRLEEAVKKWQKTSWPRELAEEWYNEIQRQILVEPFIGENKVAPADYKFFVFRGEIACIQIDSDRFDDHRRDFYSSNWRPIPYSVMYRQSDIQLKPPQHLNEMCEAASLLGREFNFARIDFYDLPAGPKFGEITFAPGAGFERFHPRKYDRWLGDFWR